MKWPWRKTAPEPAPAPVEDLTPVPAALATVRERIDATVAAADRRLDSLLERLKRLEEESP